MRGTQTVRGAYTAARPLIEQAASDEELREHLKNAYGGASSVYGQLFADRSPVGLALRVANDADLRSEMRGVAGELEAALERLRPRRSRRRRNTLLFVTGVAAVLLFNPITGPESRRWLKERVFGPEETFEYEAV